MGRDPLVTVIVPVYNAEKYLTSCLDSLVNQTYRNLEILLINDGSTDGSGEICCEYMKRDPRIRLFYQENRGQSAARNVGLDHMNGEYLTFVDADDYIDLSYIEILLGILREYRVPITVCNYDELSEEGKEQACAYSEDMIPCRKTSRNQIFDMLESWEESGCFIVIACKLYEREIFRTLRFPVGKVCEDTYIFHQIYCQVEYVCYVNLKLYHYVQSSNSTMRNNGLHQMKRDGIEAYMRRLEYFQNYGEKKYVKITAQRVILYTKELCEKSGVGDRQLQKDMRETIREIKCITGRRFCPFKLGLYIFAPAQYRWIKKLYRRIAHKQDNQGDLE